MGAETLVVALVVAGAAGFIGKRVYRTVRAARRQSGGGCGGGCCSTEH